MPAAAWKGYNMRQPAIKISQEKKLVLCTKVTKFRDIGKIFLQNEQDSVILKKEQRFLQ